MREALAKVRKELGPEAAVLHTREVRRSGLMGWLSRGRVIEITASDTVNVPSRLPERKKQAHTQPASSTSVAARPKHQDVELDISLPAMSYPPSARKSASPPASSTSENASNAFDQTRSELGFGQAHLEQDYRAKFRSALKGQDESLTSMVEQLSQEPAQKSQTELPEALFHVYTDLIEADVSEEAARELMERLRRELSPEEFQHLPAVKNRMAQLIESEMQEHGPIRTWQGKQRIVALVGPTGVGKTTTVAKLAANYRLREKLRVGLITVDTYRIAAVEQLRTYADIIDLPMEVVSTPREMREAVARMHDMDLILMDTAGRSPRDEVKIQELKSLLSEAGADEVHLVLSSVASANNLASTAEKFAPAGTTALIMTKLDEASALGNLLPLLRKSRLPMSYLTNGQNVPDDIAVADKRRLARSILQMDEQ